MRISQTETLLKEGKEKEAHYFILRHITIKATRQVSSAFHK